MVGSLKDDPRVQKSLRRLRRLGLVVYAREMEEDSVMVVIEPESIVTTVTGMVDKNITYEKHLVRYVPEKKTVVIAFWRGEKPEWVKELEKVPVRLR
jgi:hypothetical protein